MPDLVVLSDDGLFLSVNADAVEDNDRALYQNRLQVGFTLARGGSLRHQNLSAQSTTVILGRKTDQRGIERGFFDLQHVVRYPLSRVGAHTVVHLAGACQQF
jgi:hypothetical protein